MLLSFALTLGTDRLVKRVRKLSTVSFGKKCLKELTDVGLLTESLQAFRYACFPVLYNAEVRGDVSTLDRSRCPSQF